MKKAVCLISGGMDSFVCAAIARRQGYLIYGLTVDYGQKSRKELIHAKKVAKFLEAEKHIITKVDLSWTKSALTDKRIEIPRNVQADRIPSTYVPARNTIFISLALALAETADADAIFIGVNAVDFSGYPDCRPEYIRQFRKLIEHATSKTASGSRIQLKAPLLRMSKPSIIRKGASLGLDLTITWSCYKNGPAPCGTCPSCLIRNKGFSKTKP